jgi:hypothetical protein
VIIDVCKGDGVWFEQGELRLVMSFIDSGGLERARSHEAQRLAEERRLQAVRRDAGLYTSQKGGEYEVFVTHDTGSANESLLVEALHILFN